jgi:hypothetical protein
MSFAAPLRLRLKRNRAWAPNQIAGRRWAIGCVSLELTQRCNLDCTLCYLSEHAEAVRDPSLEEIFRRIAMIHAEFGPGTDIQLSGGEPTLRRREELLQIVARVRALGMRASLFTNGIRATRALLTELAAAGLTDVAFHVDTTQQRKGYATEAELNALRDEYLERARGLQIGVFFNTTVHDANLHEVPMLAAYFASRADVVRLASFQLQAQTGRGVLGAREAVSTEGVGERIRAGLGAPLSFDTFLVGHPRCNRYAVALLIGGKAHDVFFDRDFAVDFMRRTAGMRIDRATPLAGLRSLLRAACASPRLALRTAGWLARFLWRAKGDLLRGGGPVRKLTFFIHNFMDARHLEGERIESCVFMAATPVGPMSMCAYNARRDELLPPSARVYPIKLLKGRARAAALAAAMLTGCVTVPTPQAPASTPSEAISAYARVLERFVDERGAVDFAGLARDRRDLDRYVAWVSAKPPASLADHINAYNALAMYNVIDAGIPETHAGFAKIGFFMLRRVTVGGEAISLRDYENRVIRPFGDPRVHFALNCMARACPQLPRTPFRAEALDAELDRETRRFMAEARNVRVDAARRVVFLSEIFAFYPEDFPPLLPYVNRYRAERLPEDYRVEFIPYDWTVNRQ